jgi:hypothetical protein
VEKLDLESLYINKALLASVSRGHEIVARLLLERGADVKAKDDQK